MAKKEVVFISIDDLELDPENPRLPNSVNRSQEAMLEYIARETSIEELMSVIAENGFFGGEAVIAYKKPKTKHTFIVIEGNRRLTAVWLLRNPDLYPKRKRIREIAEGAEHKPKELPVIVYDKRKDVLTYLGYRHITGVKQWDPLAKARYMLQLFQQTDVQKSAEERYKEVAREIGSRGNHIRRSLDALAVFREMEETSFYNIEGLDETNIEFSVLSTALAYPSISQFVGSDTDPIVNPSSLQSDNVERLTRWMFEKLPSGETVLGESRNIKKLAAVCDNQVALSALKKGSRLEVAYRQTSGVKEEFVQHLYAAQSNLQSASSFVANVEPDDDVRALANDVSKQAKHIVRSLDNPSKDDD